MRKADRFRFANELRAWVAVVDGGIVNYGHLGQGYLGSTTSRIGPGSITFQAVALPDLRPTPEVSETFGSFRADGGRTGVAAPRYVDHPPYVRVTPPVVWTTLALTLTIRADGSSDSRWSALAICTPWIYDQSGRHVAKSGLIELGLVWEAFGSQTPWGGIDTPDLI
jgi:hypothetical protein